MIIRSRWRRAGGLATHLLRVDTNEAVRVRDDLTRDAPCDVHRALELFTAIARTNIRTTRDLIHIKVSPSLALSDDDLVGLVALIEREHAIPATMLRLVVEHAKGARARHFHLVYPVVDPATGRAIRSQDNYVRDELISRVAEVKLGERIVPGPRQDDVVAELHQRGRAHEAEVLAAHAPARRGHRLGDNTRQQAEVLAVDALVIAFDAHAIWQAAGGDTTIFEQRCTERGYVVAMGDNALLLVHEATGTHVPLARALRQKAKEAGAPLILRERDLQDAFPTAQPFQAARDAGLEAAAAKAKAAVDEELARLQAEARRDGQLQLAERLRMVRERAKGDRKARLKATLAARRAEIRADLARRDRIRRARVNRAFQAARVMDQRAMRRLVFKIAGAAVLLAGGGVGLALVAAGVAVAALPTHERARALTLATRLQREADREAGALAARQAYDALAANIPHAPKLVFAMIDKRHRAAAGAFCHLLLDEADGRLTAEQAMLKAALGRTLGDQARVLEGAMLHGGGRGMLTVLGWYDPRQPRHRQAVEATLRRDGKPTEVKTGRVNQRSADRDGRGR